VTAEGQQVYERLREIVILCEQYSAACRMTSKRRTADTYKRIESKARAAIQVIEQAEALSSLEA
jgi:hypothetical protein